jgi:hypothetical protein
MLASANKGLSPLRLVSLRASVTPKGHAILRPSAGIPVARLYRLSVCAKSLARSAVLGKSVTDRDRPPFRSFNPEPTATARPQAADHVGVAVALPPDETAAERGWQCNCHPNLAQSALTPNPSPKGRGELLLDDSQRTSGLRSLWRAE